MYLFQIMKRSKGKNSLAMVQGSSNVERAVDVMLALGDAGPDGVSLREICKKVAANNPAVHRTLAALLKKGFCQHADKHGHYRLGPAIHLLAKRNDRLEHQVSRLRPGATEFARRTGFTVYMMARAGLDAICTEMISRISRQHFTLVIGGRVPLGVAAGSLAIMSTLPRKTQEEILAANAERYATYPALRKADVNVIGAALEEAMARGFAVNMGYYLPGEGGLGLPIRKEPDGIADLAVSFNAPIEMMTERWMAEIIDELRECLSLSRPRSIKAARRSK